MGDVEETTHRPALNGATRSYIVTAGVCFSVVGLLLLGYAQEEAAKRHKESLIAMASGAPTSGQLGSPEEQAIRTKKVEELARKSQGKFESLDKTDQEFLNGLTTGHGREMLQMRWDALSNSGGAPPAQPIDPDQRIGEIVERTKGDYSKVTAEEKSHMDNFTSGHGKQYFETRTNLWKESLQGKSGTANSKSSSPAVTKK